MVDYPVVVRISKYARTGPGQGSWSTVWDINPDAMSDIRCSFLGYRVEDRAQITMSDLGRVRDSSALDILQDVMDQQDGALYRLTIFAPDFQRPIDDTSFPTGWIDSTIYWSGLILRREPDEEPGDRSIRINAVGFSAWLNRVVVRRSSYFEQTPRAILTDVFTNVIQTDFPGDLSLMTRVDGTDDQIVLPSRHYESSTARAVLDDLSTVGNFFYGISCSGWPNAETEGTTEFRLVFFEAHNDLDITPPVPGVQGLGYGGNLHIDLDDPRLISYRTLRDDEQFTNRWDFAGAALHVDAISIVSGHDGDEIRDHFAVLSTTTGLQDREFRGARGWSIVLTDRARNNVFNDPDSGNRFDAGGIFPLDESIVRIDGDSEFFIFDFTEIPATTLSGSYARYSLGDWPAPSNNLTLPTSSTVLRYLLRPNGARVLRRVTDTLSSGAATGREPISKLVQNSLVIGHLQAGLFAYQDRWAERWNAEQVQLRLLKVVDLPNGSHKQTHNLVTVSTGSERITRYGVPSAGGDSWAMGDDERPIGLGKVYEIQRVDMTYTEDGWEATYVLGAAPRELGAVLFEQGVVPA